MKTATCEDILLIFPELKTKMNWTYHDVGHAVKMKIVNGHRTKKTTFVEIASIKKLIVFINQNLEEQKLKVNNNT